MAVALIEGSGGIVTGGIVRHMQQAGLTVVCIDSMPHSAALYLADAGKVIPPAAPAEYLDTVREICRSRGVALAFPTVPAMLLDWSRQIGRFGVAGTAVIVSPPETIETCQDKWLFYQFFRDRGVPLPQTSLRGEFPLIKPRFGSGGAGVFLVKQPVDMAGRISQEFLEGEEFSADVLCDLSGAIVTRCVRKRLRTVGGAAVAGVTVDHPEISGVVDRICAGLVFRGPVNIQFIQTARGVYCTEVNPRLGGGVTLSLAASTGNWFTAVLAMVQGQPVAPLHSRIGLMVTRYYVEMNIEAERISAAAGPA